MKSVFHDLIDKLLQYKVKKVGKKSYRSRISPQLPLKCIFLGLLVSIYSVGKVNPVKLLSGMDLQLLSCDHFCKITLLFISDLKKSLNRTEIFEFDVISVMKAHRNGHLLIIILLQYIFSVDLFVI